jgi:hypothetical protein
LSKVCRSVLVPACRELSTWSICTGALVCVTGIVLPEWRFGPDGLPGSICTKKLPSRNSLGRILSVASLWIGSPFLFMLMVTSAAPVAVPFESL